MAVTLTVGDQPYGRPEALELRAGLIVLRDEAMKQGSMHWAVHLTHSIGVMQAMIDHIWPEEARVEGTS